MHTNTVCPWEHYPARFVRWVKHSSKGQPSCSHMASLFQCLMKSTNFPFSTQNSAAAVHRALRPVGSMSPFALPSVCSFSRIPNRDTIAMSEKDIEVDDVQVIHGFHQLPVIFRVLFERMNVRKRAGRNETVIRAAEVRHGPSAGALRIVADFHVLSGELQVVPLRRRVIP